MYTHTCFDIVLHYLYPLDGSSSSVYIYEEDGKGLSTQLKNMNYILNNKKYRQFNFKSLYDRKKSQNIHQS